MKRGIGVLIVAAGLVVASVAAGPPAEAARTNVFRLTSPGHRDNGVMPLQDAGNRPGNANCVGQNVSPPLEWSDAPAGTKSFALLIFDPEAGNGLGFSQTVIYGIPASAKGFAAGGLSQPSDQYVGGKNGAGMAIYGGPCTPPDTDWHHYIFTLIATDLDPKALQPGMTRDELFAALKGHAKASAGLIFRFKHPKTRRAPPGR